MISFTEPNIYLGPHVPTSASTPKKYPPNQERIGGQCSSEHFFFTHSMSNASILEFKHHTYPYYYTHKRFKKFVPTVKNESEHTNSGTDFCSIFKQATTLANSDSTEGAIQIKIAVGALYVHTESSPYFLQNKEMSIKDFNALVSQSPFQQTNASFKRRSINRENMVAFLEKNDFEISGESSKYHVHFNTGTFGKHSSLSFTENMALNTVRLKDSRWTVANICNGIDGKTGMKKMDAQLKFFTRKTDVEIDSNPIINPLKRDSEGNIFVCDNFKDRVHSVFLTKITWYKHKGSDGQKSLWSGVSVKIHSSAEYQSPHDGKVSCMVCPSFPGFDKSEEELDEFARRLWSMMTTIIDVVEQ